MPPVDQRRRSVKKSGFLSMISLSKEPGTNRRRRIREAFDPFPLEGGYARRCEVLQLGQFSKESHDGHEREAVAVG